MNDLQSLRAEIDSIDEQIVKLFVKRFAVVEKVKVLKDLNTKNIDDFYLHIKPNREFGVVSNVLKMGNVMKNSDKLFFHTWRGIISFANFLEQKLNLIATCEISKNSLYEYYLMQKNVEIENVKIAFEELDNDEFHILAFHFSNSHAFEILKKSEKIKVFAQSANGVFLCGKILEPKFTKPALILIQEEAEIVINENACVFASQDITKHCQKNTLGAFYPYFL